MDDNATTAEHLRRISNLLALLATKGESQTDKILTLSAAGYSSKEIADLLRTSPNNVSVAIYKAKQGAGRKRKAK